MIVLFPSLPLENTGLYKKQIEISQMIERRLQLFSFFSHRDTRNTSIVDIQMTTTPFYTHESLCPLFWALLKKKKKNDHDTNNLKFSDVEAVKPLRYS